MAQIVLCPKCQAKGSVPDGVPKARIRCPKCEHQFDYRSPTPDQRRRGGSSGKRATSNAPKPSTAFDDLEPVQPLATAGGSSVRRSSAVPGAHGTVGSGFNPMLYALVGISGVAAVLLGVVVVMMTRGTGGGGDAEPKPRPQAVAAIPETSPEPAPQSAPVVARVQAVPDPLADQRYSGHNPPAQGRHGLPQE